MPETTLDGITLNYEEQGSGPPVVLIHGFPLDSRMWQAQLQGLSARFRVIAPDLPGFGRSHPARPFTMVSAAELIHELLHALDALPCVIGGLSMGGYICLAHAECHPADLKGLMLVDTRAEADTAEAKANRLKMIDLVRAAGAGPIAQQMEPKMLAPHSLQSRPALLQQVRAMMESQDPLALEHALTGMREREDFRDRLASIVCPTLIVVGEQDAITPPAVARGLHEHIPHSRLALIPEAGHLSPMENPQAVNAAMLEFLQGLGA